MTLCNKRIIFISTRRVFGNRYTGCFYGMGLLSLWWRGLALHVLLRKDIYRAHVRRVVAWGVSKRGAAFPIDPIIL